MIILYIKTHNKTGLRYFGKTEGDPYTYKGSGKRWLNHIRYHSNDVSTEILGKFENYEECKRAALSFSVENDIVNSPLWANLKIEELDGGWNHINGDADRKIETSRKGGKAAQLKHPNLAKNLVRFVTAESRAKATKTIYEKYGDDHFQKLGKYERTEEHRKKHSELAKNAGFGKMWKGVKKPLVVCPHCQKEGAVAPMTRFHFDKCKKITGR